MAIQAVFFTRLAYEPSDSYSKKGSLHGKVSHSEMFYTLMRSRVGLCSSSHEGSHVASEEALCARASVVASFRKQLNAMIWYVSHDSGRLSVDDSARGLAETLILELEAWDRGERAPISISDYWCSKLSASAGRGSQKNTLFIRIINNMAYDRAYFA
jgi:hypothetical protein